jgi:ribosomal protein S12 methylthiotransferase accessory factor YcaO
VYDFLKKQGFKLVLKDISLNWPVYVVHATLIDKKEYMPAFSHGTGSSFSLKEATEKAISEAIQVYSGLSEIAKYEKNKVVNVEGVIGNCRLAWLDPLIYPHIKHLISKNKAKTKRKKTNSMNELIKLIKKENHEVLSSKIVEVGDLTLVRTYITGATHPDDRLERISKKLEKNIKLYCPRGAYWDPILI